MSYQPEAYLAARVEKLRAAMRAAGAENLLVTSFADVSYITGFEGDDSFALVTPEKVILISDFRYTEQISRECPWVSTIIRSRGMAETVGAALKRFSCRTVAVQAEAMTLRQMESLRKALPKRYKVLFKPVDEIVVKLRHIKDAHEIAIIEQAVAIAEHAFGTLKAHLRVGVSENHVASRLTHEMRKLGAQGASFDSIVAVGANGSLPHYRPGAQKIQQNSAVLIDWGARARGYCSDLTRMLFVGQAPAKIREIYAIVLEAQQAAIAAIKPGKKARQIDGIARGIIKKAGYGKEFGHGLGHAIGRNVHEAVSLSRSSDAILAPGMVLTVEPGIYLPGIGGVRIEDDVLVTQEGCRVLSHLPKTLDAAQM